MPKTVFLPNTADIDIQEVIAWMLANQIDFKARRQDQPPGVYLDFRDPAAAMYFQLRWRPSADAA